MSQEVVSKVSRKKTRKFLFQRLFSQCFSHTEDSLFTASFLLPKFRGVMDEAYLSEMERLIHEKEYVFLHLIKTYSPRFEIGHMSSIYLIPIYIGACEMLFFSEEIPAKVSINEAVELAKVYGDDSAKKMVNAVLNKIYESYDSISQPDYNFGESSDQTIFYHANS